jgi:hypothetical protein
MLACNTVDTMPAPRTGVTEMQPTEPKTFVFTPPAFSHLIWTERRTFDVSVAGSPDSEHDESEFRWDLSAHPSLYDTTVVDERPLYVSVSDDGRSIVEGAPAPSNVQLVIDDGGNLQDVRGLNETSRALRFVAAPVADARAARLLSPEAIRTIAVTRYDLFVGDLVGRPTGGGATWIVPRRSGDAALLRRYTVEGPKQCGDRMCSALRVHIDLDPHAIDGLAVAAVERHGRWYGGTSGLQLRSVVYAMDGEILVDPRTMRTFGATLADTGRAVVGGPNATFEVSVRGLTQDTFHGGT